jgi:hypothetical protein
MGKGEEWYKGSEGSQVGQCRLTDSRKGLEAFWWLSQGVQLMTSLSD